MSYNNSYPINQQTHANPISGPPYQCLTYLATLQFLILACEVFQMLLEAIIAHYKGGSCNKYLIGPFSVTDLQQITLVCKIPTRLILLILIFTVSLVQIN